MNNIMADLKKAAADFQVNTGYKATELFVTGRQLVEMYRLGFLVPGDESVNVYVPVADIKLVNDYLAERDT